MLEEPCSFRMYVVGLRVNSQIMNFAFFKLNFFVERRVGTESHCVDWVTRELVAVLLLALQLLRFQA